MRKKLFPAAVCAVFFISGFAVSHSEEAGKTLEKAADYRIIPDVKIIRKINLSGGYHEGLFLTGNDIWINNGYEGKTWVLNIKNGEIISEIDPVGTFTEGLTRADNKRYRVTDWHAKALYLVRIENKKMIAESRILFEPSHPAGVLWNGTYLYIIIWTRGMGTKYHLLKMDKEGNLLDKIRIKHIIEPSQLAWDGKSLWISSFFQRRVYRIDEKSLTITGYFRFPAVKDITGIAWQGKYLWLTGSSADLYKLELSE